MNNTVKLINIKSQIESRIETLQQQSFALLNEFQTDYVRSGKNPTNQEDKNALNSTIHHLKTFENTFIQIIRQIMDEIDTMNGQLILIHKGIEKEKKTMATYDVINQKREDKYNGSIELIDNSKQIYNASYSNNFMIFMGILGVFIGGFFSIKENYKTIKPL
jgi:hypothetical protein